MGTIPTLADQDRAIRTALGLFLDKLQPSFDVAEVRLFGSRARGDYRTDSDVDIAIILRGDRLDFIDTTLCMSDITYDVLLETGVTVSPFPLWEDDWLHPERTLNPRLVASIKEHGIRL